MRRAAFRLVWIGLVWLQAMASGAIDDRARVIVLANSADPESVELARFYAGKRAIPEANIVALPMPLEETISWTEFSGQIFNPLLEWLIEHEWIDAVPGDLRDAVGRIRVAPLGHRISYLVTCRGVPLRIAHEEALLTSRDRAALQEPFRTNRAAVDSELALLAWVAPPVNGLVENPLFRDQRPAASDKVVRVSRIDGPSPADCRRMIESGLAGEKLGVAGRAYVDLGGPHTDGEAWLRNVAAGLSDLYFDVSINEDREVFAATERFDAPAFYFGWYAADVIGPFRLRGFSFAPGAVAVHIHSFSAATVRAAESGWVGPFVHRGAAATVGNVYEPYLELSHRPDLFFERLRSGATLGEAAFYALPALSWQAVVFGDPLYRPFAVSLEAQVSGLGDRTDPEASYVVIREANRLNAAGDVVAAERVLDEGFREHPGLALGLRLAQARLQAGRKSGAQRAMSVFRLVSTFHPQEVALVAEGADVLGAMGEHRGAVGLYRRLLEDEPLEPFWRRALLPRAIAEAEAGGFSVQLKYWREAWEALNVPSQDPR